MWPIEAARCPLAGYQPKTEGAPLAPGYHRPCAQEGFPGGGCARPGEGRWECSQTPVFPYVTPQLETARSMKTDVRENHTRERVAGSFITPSAALAPDACRAPYPATLSN
jgi:hypothetical protein